MLRPDKLSFSYNEICDYVQINIQYRYERHTEPGLGAFEPFLNFNTIDLTQKKFNIFLHAAKQQKKLGYVRTNDLNFFCQMIQSPSNQ